MTGDAEAATNQQARPRSYRQLDAACIIETADRLQRRVSERFPGNDDRVTLEAIDAVESLIGISQKIWQKLMIIHEHPLRTVS